MDVHPFTLERDPWGRLVLIDEDGRHVGVEPVRAFPISDPNRWVSICEADGSEILCVEDLATLPGTTRRALEEELSRREFVPVIRRIVRVVGETPPTDWDVVTDRGPTRFTLDSDDRVRKLGDGRVMITDAQGLRYLVADARALDAASRRLLDRFL